MEAAPYTARRATIDDLALLLELWNSQGLPGVQLEKFLTEFQVVANEFGALLGAVGLLTEGTEGLIHSEAVLPGEEADDVRHALWKRILAVARNQGLARLWTQEDAPFWLSTMPAASPEALQSMQASFADPEASWRCVQLHDAAQAKVLVAEQMAIWQATRTQEASSFRDQIQKIRLVALGITAFIIIVIVLLALYVFSSNPQILNRMLGR